MITYLNGDATAPVITTGNVFIPHVVNTNGGWGKGFVLALSQRWAKPEADYRQWHKTGIGVTTYANFELGQFDLSETVANGPEVIHLLAQEGYKSAANPVALRYDALEKALSRLGTYCIGKEKASFHMPRIGTGLAGGNWAEIEKIIQRTIEPYGSVYIYTP